MDKATIVVITLVLYQGLLVAVGYWASKRINTEEDYFLGGRQLGPFVAAMSYSASSSSAWSLLGMSGAAYMYGISSLWVALGAILGSVLAWTVVAPRLRRFSHEHDTVTIADFLGHSLSEDWQKKIVKLSAVVILISFAFYVAAQFQGAGNTFATTFDMPMAQAVILGAVIIMVYTFLGGFWAVSVTDAIQGTLMVGASVALPVMGLIEIGGFNELMSGLAALDKPELLTISGENVGLAAFGFILGSIAIGFGPIGQPHLLVRFMALRDEKAMRQARVLTLIWFVIVFAGMFFVGLEANVLIPNPAVGPEGILFELTDMVFPPVIGAIILAAVLSAIMSTADSQLLVGASSISYDLKLGKKYKGKEVLVSRLSVAFLVVMAVLISLYMPATIFERALFAWNALGAAFGPVIVMKLMGNKYSGRTIYMAILTGFGSAVILSFFQDAPGDVLERTIPFILGFGILLLNRIPKND